MLFGKKRKFLNNKSEKAAKGVQNLKRVDERVFIYSENVSFQIKLENYYALFILEPYFFNMFIRNNWKNFHNKLEKNYCFCIINWKKC